MTAHRSVTPDPAGTAAEAKSLVERLHMGDVYIRRLAGEVFVRPPLVVTKIGLRLAAPDVQIKQSHFACRFAERVVLLDGAGQHLALVEVLCVVEFRLDDGPEPDSEALSAYASHEAYYVAQPYLREAIQTTTTKLGLDPAVLAVLDSNARRLRT
jgi:hypothetical protein